MRQLTNCQKLLARVKKHAMRSDIRFSFFFTIYLWLWAHQFYTEWQDPILWPSVNPKPSRVVQKQWVAQGVPRFRVLNCFCSSAFLGSQTARTKSRINAQTIGLFCWKCLFGSSSLVGKWLKPRKNPQTITSKGIPSITKLVTNSSYLRGRQKFTTDH